MLWKIFLYFPSKGKVQLSPADGLLNDGHHSYQGLCSLMGSAFTPFENLSQSKEDFHSPLLTLWRLDPQVYHTNLFLYALPKCNASEKPVPIPNSYL